MTAFYNENDPKAAAWLRELIARGLIAPGVVDERDVRDIRPAELAGYSQCHFFAGIGVWSYALRQAGGPDDRPVWTGSCPCQPFSAAGKGEGFDDERHLWPSWFWLIEQCRPAIVFGEQVASKDAEPWIDLVSDDLEAVGYSVGAVPFPAAGVGAPHIRDRLYWVADATSGGLGEFRAALEPGRVRHADRSGLTDGLALSQRGGCEGWEPSRQGAGAIVPSSSAGGMAFADGGQQRQQPQDGSAGLVADASEPGRFARGRDTGQGDGRGTPRLEPRRLRDAGGVADSDSGQRGGLTELRGTERDGQDTGRPQGSGEPSARRDNDRTGPINGLWRDADWLLCRDGKWRPVEPGTFPLAHGAPARVGRLRGYGNGLVAQAAQTFIEAYLQ